MKSVFVAVVALVSGAALAQSIALHPGESVTVRLENGTAIVEQRDAAPPMTKFEIYALWRAETEDVPRGVKVVPPGFVLEGEGPPNPPVPSDQRLRITMLLVPGIKPNSRENTVLFIADGYGSALRYRAMMNKDGTSAPTDVCTVAPHLLGLEHWPYPIQRLDLSELRLEQYNSSVDCQ